MSEFGLKIKNISAGSLFGYKLGVRDHYDYTEAMLSHSLFTRYMEKNGLTSWKGESTRDVVCLCFDFGSRSFEEEEKHLTDKIRDKSTPPDKKEILQSALENVRNNKSKYCKKTKEEIRDIFYNNGVSIDYTVKDKNGNIKNNQEIYYKMLYRSPAKAKLGQSFFINSELYDKAYDWLTMGMGGRMPKDNAKIVEMSAYAPLVTSTIVGDIHIPVEDILILEDQDSFFRTISKVVDSEDYTKLVNELNIEKTEENKQKAIVEGKFLADGSPDYKKSYKTVERTSKKCIVKDECTDVKNTVWDGMGLIESSLFPTWGNGMLLLRNHFFKMCGFRSNLQMFFKDWCKKTGNDYDTYKVKDMFGKYHYLKDVKVITTDNSIKWKKFIDLMGGTPPKAYEYWCKRVNDDGSVFGIVKTDHPSKLGDVQQLSYQMVNTLPCTKDDIFELAKTSVEYVEKLKNDNDEFEKFLIKNSNDVNHYEMMTDLYRHNNDFANSKWFRKEKNQIIRGYINKLRKGKITVNGDNLTICGNPYALLLYSVGEDWQKDPTLNYEDGVIQCYTTRFEDNEFLCGIRNPHNSPNNICYLKNCKSIEMEKYFPFSTNIMAINCIETDAQSRLNGADFDGDFLLVTNNSVMVKCAKKCYEEYPTIVNNIDESGITYQNTLQAYSDMDNNFAKSKLGIGWSSNLAQLAMTYYWTTPNKELYDNFVILSVIAQVIIDSCKKEYVVSGMEEIKRIRRMDCMDRYEIVADESGKEKKVPCDYPMFMRYTKEIKYTRNGKDRPQKEINEEKGKIEKRINYDFVCPMNWLQEILDGIKISKKNRTVPTEDFFIKMEGKANNRQMSKIKKMVSEYDEFVKQYKDNFDEHAEEIVEKFRELVENLQKIKVGNIVTINRLIETTLNLETGLKREKKSESTKYSRRLLNALYKMDKEKFLNNFVGK